MNMLRNSISIALRQLMRHKVYSAINIAGLSVSVAACIMLWSYVRFETSFNAQYPDADRIYQVYTTLYSQSMEPYTAQDLAPELKRVIPGVQRFVRLHWNEALLQQIRPNGDKNGQSVSPLHFVEESFLEMFPQTLLAGDLKHALKAPNSLVITRETALKFFESPAAAIGERLLMKSEWMDQELIVTAVVEDNPAHTTIRFEGLTSVEPPIQSPFYQHEPRWNNFFTFVKIGPETDIGRIGETLPRLVDQYTAGAKPAYGPEIFFQPIRDTHLTHGDPRKGPDNMTVNLLLMISAFIMIIAW